MNAIADKLTMDLKCIVCYGKQLLVMGVLLRIWDEFGMVKNAMKRVGWLLNSVVEQITARVRLLPENFGIRGWA